MRRLFALILLAFLPAFGGVAAAASDHDLPWSRFSDPAFTSAATMAGLDVCPRGDVLTEIFVGAYKSGERFWIMFYAPDSGRILFLYSPRKNADLEEIEVGVGQVDLMTPGAHDLVPPLRWQKLQGSVYEHMSPCQALYPSET